MAVDPTGPVDIVCVAEGNVDPSIDVDASNLDEYQHTRDPKHLRFKLGMSPTKFTMRPIKASYALDKLENMPPGSRAMLAFAAACHRVTLPDGTVLKPKKLNADAVYGVEVSDADWIDEVASRCRLVSVREMGWFAIRRAGEAAGALGPFDWPASLPGSTPST